MKTEWPDPTGRVRQLTGRLNKSSADLLTLDIPGRRELGLEHRLPGRSSAAWALWKAGNNDGKVLPITRV